MDLSTVILFVLISYIVSKVGMAILTSLELEHMKDRVALLKKLDDIIHRVKVEKFNDIEYWFDADDDEFLAQGKSHDEIVNVLKSRFPTHIFLCENAGGMCANTKWKFVPTDQLKNYVETKA